MKTKVLFAKEQIQARIKELGQKISATYTDGKPILCVGVLKGAFMFFSSLVVHIKGDVLVDFITLSSYGSGSQTSGEVKLVNGLREDVEGRHVLIIEDIIDSGLTVSYLRKHFVGKGALSVSVACLVDKKLARKIDATVDYAAFTLNSSAFLAGYGLDYDQRYRNLDCIMEVELE